MRLFTGISLPEVPQAWTDLRRKLPLNWSPDEKLHITIRFIGEWPEERLGELQNELSGLPRVGNIPVTLNGFGFLKTVFYAGVKAGPGLYDLANSSDYLPHVTLARIKGADAKLIRDEIAGRTDLDFGSFEATEFHLYQSRSSVYTKLASYPL